MMALSTEKKTMMTKIFHNCALAKPKNFKWRNSVCLSLSIYIFYWNGSFLFFVVLHDVRSLEFLKIDQTWPNKPPNDEKVAFLKKMFNYNLLLEMV